jgi:hypothetical protein
MVFTMRLKIDYPARLATVTLEDESQVDLAGLDVFIQKAMNDPVGLMAIELIVPAGDMTSEELRKRGFVVSGSVTKDTVTSIVMRKKLSSPSFADTPRSVFFNPEIQVPAPVLQQTPAEVSAHKGLDVSLAHHYSEDSVNRRLAVIEADAAKTRAIREG